MNTKKLLKNLILFIGISLCGMVFAQENLLETSINLDWDTPAVIDAAAFDSARASYLLSFTYKNVKAEDHMIQIASGDNKPLVYGVVKGAEEDDGYLYPDKSAGTFTYTLSARDASAIRQKGLSLTGEGLKITKITCAPAPAPKVTAKKVKAPVIKVEANPKPEFAAGTPFAKHGKLKVNGAYLYDQNNNKFMLYGMSTHGIAWFPQYVNKDALKTLRDDWNTNCFRLALYPRENMGYCQGGDRENLKKLIFKGIDAATELGMYVIVDWHVLAYNPNDLLEEAMLFFSEVSQKYAKYDNVIYELCNEPTNAPWDSAIKPYAENLIPVIRKNAPNSIIIVGTNTWSQDIEEPLKNPLKQKNIMYSYHFYADSHRDSFRDRVENVISSGLPLFITEFGTCNASGNGGFTEKENNKWFDLIKEYNISHMNWSIANKAETASIIRPDCPKISGWTYDELTESGKLIHDHFNSLEQ